MKIYFLASLFSEIFSFELKMASRKAPGPYMMNKCVNCWVYNWVQPDPSILQKCKQCKIVQYCGQDCQAEHWKACHKSHCKKLMAAKEAWREGDWHVSLISHHPFPVTGMPGDTTEALVISVIKVIGKMRETGHPACSTNAALLDQIWAMAGGSVGQIYANRKVYPPACTPFTEIQSTDLHSQISMVSFDETEDQLGLWHTLNLIMVCLIQNKFIQHISSMKEPQVSVPEELWQGVDKEVGIFPDVVQQMNEVFSTNRQIPPFKRLLEIVCGGSLNNACTFCNKQIVIRAIAGQVGSECGVPTVWVTPYSPRIFECIGESCLEQSSSKILLMQKWRVGVNAAVTQLVTKRCNFCFKFSEKVHR